MPRKPPTPTPALVQEILRAEMARRGAKGGKARAANLGERGLSEAMSKAAKARWADAPRPERCACGQMTATRAAARGHKCEAR